MSEKTLVRIETDVRELKPDEAIAIALECGVAPGFFRAPQKLLGAAVSEADLDIVDAIDELGERILRMEGQVAAVHRHVTTPLRRASREAS